MSQSALSTQIQTLEARLGHPITRKVVEVARVGCEARHQDVEAVLPDRHADRRARHDLPTTEEERQLAAFEVQHVPSKLAERAVDVWCLHEPEAQGHTREPIIYLLDRRALSSVDARRVAGFDGQDDDLVVQDVVVLEIVEQCRRRRVRIARQVDRGSRCMERRAALDLPDETIKRDSLRTTPLEQIPRAARPGPHRQPDQRAQHEGYVAALRDLQKVGGEECELDQQDGSGNACNQQPRPLPDMPQHEHGQPSRDQYRAADRDAVGCSHGARALELEDEEQNAGHQGNIDRRKIYLATLSIRSMADLEARQQAELYRLPGHRKRAGDDGLARDHCRERCEDDQWQQRPVRRQQKERVFQRGRIRQHQSALTEVVEGQCREDQREPSILDRAAAKMTEVGIERLRPRHGQEDRTQHEEPRLTTRATDDGFGLTITGPSGMTPEAVMGLARQHLPEVGGGPLSQAACSSSTSGSFGRSDGCREIVNLRSRWTAATACRECVQARST